MAGYTPNLGLYKKDPVTDGNDTFNIETMLNQNWDKIDQDKKAQDDAAAAHLAESASETVKGHIELATAAETTTGTDNTRAVHPAGLKVELDKKLPLTGGTLTGALNLAHAVKNLIGAQGNIEIVNNGGLPLTIACNMWHEPSAGDKYISAGYKAAKITIGFDGTISAYVTNTTASTANQLITDWQNLLEISPTTGMVAAANFTLNNNVGLYGKNSAGSYGILIKRGADDITYIGESTFNNAVVLQGGDLYFNSYRVYHEGNPPLAGAARVTHNADQSIATYAETALAFNTEVYDTNNLHDTVANNSRLTATVAGRYRISANIRWAASTSGYRAIFFKVNGSIYIAYNQVQPVGAAGATTDQVLTTAWDLALNDYVECFVLQTSGGALSVLNNQSHSAHFMMERVV